MQTRRVFLKALLGLGAFVLPWSFLPTRLEEGIKTGLGHPPVKLLLPPVIQLNSVIDENSLSRTAMDDIFALTGSEMQGRKAGSVGEAKAAEYQSSQLSILERNSEFSGVLSQTQKIKRQELQTFLNRLETQGKKLAQSLSIRDLKDFRDMVKSFLRSTFGQSRKMQEDSSWDSQGRPKVMARIAKIDQSLDELGKQLLNQQAKPLEVLTKIDEIRGLIVDLFA